MLFNGNVAQRIEQQISNLSVMGSNPLVLTLKIWHWVVSLTTGVRGPISQRLLTTSKFSKIMAMVNTIFYKYLYVYHFIRYNKGRD
jgi:hypothetical protein